MALMSSRPSSNTANRPDRAGADDEHVSLDRITHEKRSNFPVIQAFKGAIAGDCLGGMAAWNKGEIKPLGGPLPGCIWSR